ncbi:hypothetical protein TW84_07155 [Vibrio neptunius]|uniref:hypothetical protein n=1 Tax=Vibrio neptunius TaxID=170651 RepID=UPI0005F9B0A6|nr:hypothetical protein [Vibrio neptunius]KJY92083.1 hypothetical protein TW84_07155 [Vibrio neptunius]
MTKPTIEQVNQILTQADFVVVARITSYYQIWEVIDAILEDSNLSEETNFERIRVLLRAGILTDLNILEFYNSHVEDMDLSYEHCPLVKILSPLERDGTLYFSGCDSFYEDLCYDLYLDYIKSIVRLGGKVDCDGILRWVFNEHRREFYLFNYLLDNFTVKPETINSVAGAIILNNYWQKGSSEEQREAKAAFEKLIEKGIDINLTIEEDDWHSQFNSFLGIAFCYDPELFEQYLLQKPSQQIIANLPWDFSIKEELFDDKQVRLVHKLIGLGYQLPLDEIIELLEEEELDDYAKALVL